ncbi:MULTISPECIES: amino acid ABC transporter permease [unclassified Bacillus (in: firmicutes)]|uniref:amino acid ABC transporter permease n=1 Tax=unclassified Bacillus (in: firmicutes) TaxID=185979 RepID=UPI0008EB8DA0|nr:MULTISPECIES: amino acid ABC transporter permease [unclassified Bacillus (in: firmicutes)]SFJ77739.1 amino acid ABC transporter membrane protein, PAAT family [Bacillus sp. 71mf]SFS98658.1 amino acid ABC transporter membrane protein, PAAT family [Bacillus sp. 103mf]
MYLSNAILDLDRLSVWVDITKASFMPMLKGALFNTIPLTLITFIIGLALATLTALCRISGNRVLEWIARIYVSIIRGTPLLVQLFIIFYGLPTIGITIDSFPAAIIGFSLNVGAYASEIIRASILSIPKGQWEAAYTIGMSYPQALRRVILPQATRVSIPPLSNTFISLIKDTSLASLILVTEMFRKAQEIAATNYEFLIVYTEAGLIYWVICFLLSIVQQMLEKRTERYILK